MPPMKALPVAQAKRPKNDAAMPLAPIPVNHGPSSPPSKPALLSVDLSNLPGERRFPHRAPALPEVMDGAMRQLVAAQREYQVDPDHLRHHPQLNPRMRAILVDWLYEVGQEYTLKRETVHVAINYVDRFLSRTKGVQKSELQLVGVVALWMSSKVEEILPPPVSDFAAATDSGCSAMQIIAMEKRLLETLTWHIVPPTAHAWANLYLHCLLMDVARAPLADNHDMWTLPSVVPHLQIHRVMELIDFAMLDLDSLCFLPSQLAASAIALLISRDSNNTYTLEDLERIAHSSMDELRHCMTWMAFTLNLPSNSQERPRCNVNACIEPHTIQRHHFKALEEYSKEMARRGGPKENPLRHRACVDHLRAVALRERAESEAENSELTSIGGLTGVDNAERNRAFSPVAMISHLMSNTAFKGS